MDTSDETIAAVDAFLEQVIPPMERLITSHRLNRGATEPQIRALIGVLRDTSDGVLAGMERLTPAVATCADLSEEQVEAAHELAKRARKLSVGMAAIGFVPAGRRVPLRSVYLAELDRMRDTAGAVRKFADLLGEAATRRVGRS